jgi:hypothetical protein
VFFPSTTSFFGSGFLGAQDLAERREVAVEAGTKTALTFFIA